MQLVYTNGKRGIILISPVVKKMHFLTVFFFPLPETDIITAAAAASN